MHLVSILVVSGWRVKFIDELVALLTLTIEVLDLVVSHTTFWLRLLVDSDLAIHSITWSK